MKPQWQLTIFFGSVIGAILIAWLTKSIFISIPMFRIALLFLFGFTVCAYILLRYVYKKEVVILLILEIFFLFYFVSLNFMAENTELESNSYTLTLVPLFLISLPIIFIELT